MTAIAAQAKDVNTIFGAMIIGGVVAILVGLFIRQIRKVFPPLVIGTVFWQSVFPLQHSCKLYGRKLFQYL